MARLYPAAVRRLAPAVGGLRGSHQRIAQFPQFGGTGSFVEGRGHIFCCASHLVDPVGQVGGLVSRQHDCVWGHQRAWRAVDGGSLLIGPLATGLPAVLTATAQPVLGDIASTPAARLRADATAHRPDFSRADTAIPVSWMLESHGAETVSNPGNSADRPSVVQGASC
jgi:hypothetical protein